MHGKMKKRPGPEAPPCLRRPSLNITARSYSWTILTQYNSDQGSVAAMSSMENPDNRRVPNAEMSLVRAWELTIPNWSKSVRVSSAALFVGPEGMPEGGGGGGAKSRCSAACCASKSSVCRASFAASASAAMADFPLLPPAFNDMVNWLFIVL